MESVSAISAFILVVLRNFCLSSEASSQSRLLAAEGYLWNGDEGNDDLPYVRTTAKALWCCFRV
jgi:hypothetical protein